MLFNTLCKMVLTIDERGKDGGKLAVIDILWDHSGVRTPLEHLALGASGSRYNPLYASTTASRTALSRDQIKTSIRRTPMMADRRPNSEATTKNSIDSFTSEMVLEPRS